METWIRRACRQRCYRIFATWVLLLIGVIAINIAFKDYWANFFQGPYSLSSTDIQSLREHDPAREFVTVEGNEVVPSGIQVITTETKNGVKQREYASSDYYVMRIGQKMLVVNATQQPGLQVSGELKSLPPNLPGLMLPDAADAYLRSSILPLMLDTTEHYRTSGYVSLVLMAVFLFLFWVFAVRAFKHTQDITLHPVVRRIEGWKDAVDVTMQAELEQSRSLRFKRSDILITDNFVIVRGLYSFDLLPFNHLLWAYKKVTTQRINFLPVARTSSAELIFYGGSTTFSSRKKLVEEVLLYAAVRAPWAVFGYSEELNTLFKKDRAGFTSAVEERRMQLQQ